MVARRSDNKAVFGLLVKYDIIRQHAESRRTDLLCMDRPQTVPRSTKVSNSCLHCSAILYHTIVFSPLLSLLLSRLLPPLPSPRNAYMHCLAVSSIENAVGLSRSVDSLLNPFCLRTTFLHLLSSPNSPQRGTGGTPSILLWLLSVCSSWALLRVRLHAVRDDDSPVVWRTGPDDTSSECTTIDNCEHDHCHQPSEPLLDIAFVCTMNDARRTGVVIKPITRKY